MASCNKVPSHWKSKSQKKTHRRYWTKEIEDKLASLVKAETELADAQKVRLCLCLSLSMSMSESMSEMV